MSQSASWSDDRVATLSKLWLDGLSASQIAKQLGGVTRNAVIGKVHRLGLSGRAAPSSPARAPRISAPRAPRAPKAASPARVGRPALRLVVSVPAVAQGRGLVGDLAHLGAHACKWPIGDPKSADFSFCGCACAGRYCDTHETLGSRPGTACRADRDPVVRRALAGLV